MSEDKYDEDEDLDEVNQKCIDEDAEYERYRDDAGDSLHEALKELIKKFDETKGYYHNSKSKLLQHMIADLTFELEQENGKKWIMF